MHILGWLCTTNIGTHCLQNVTIDPTNYGYEHKNGSLVPRYNPNNVSEGLIQTCSCKNCSAQHCACRNIDIPCCVYCKFNVIISRGGAIMHGSIYGCLSASKVIKCLIVSCIQHFAQCNGVSIFQCTCITIHFVAVYIL